MIKPLLLSLFLLILLPTLAGGVEVANLTRENSDFLAKKVEALSREELWQISRGRRKLNPVSLSAFTIYQAMLTSREFLLARHTDQFVSSLERLRKIPERRLPVSVGIDVGAVTDFYETELVRRYRLENTISEAKTLIEVWRELEGLMYMMEAAPVQAEMAIGARRWLEEYYGGAPPERALLQWETIMRKRVVALSVLEMSGELDKISAEYSRLMLSAARGEFR